MAKKELYRIHRPKTVEQLVGQDSAVKQIQKLLKSGWPHAVCLAGPSGVGKTTTVRALRKVLGADNDLDYKEINAADLRGIEEVRGICARAGTAPAAGKGIRLWNFDEAHQLTKPAQNALLTTLEDPPPTAYFIISTSEPHQLIKAIRTRCTIINFKPIAEETLVKLMMSVGKKEGVVTPHKVLRKIASVVEGSARKALVVLNQVMHLDNEEDMMSVVERVDTKTAAYELAKAIIFPKKYGGPKAAWKLVAELITNFEEEPERFRQLILKFAETMVLKHGYMRAAYVLECFKEPVHYSGRPGITLAAYDAMNARS